ncbi:hypothetical protein [Thermosynechococcus sp. CL-1]|nr:hypothetical protein [Thermosynechococcus sp. CL-1]
MALAKETERAIASTRNKERLILPSRPTHRPTSCPWGEIEV